MLLSEIKKIQAREEERFSTLEQRLMERENELAKLPWQLWERDMKIVGLEVRLERLESYLGLQGAWDFTYQSKTSGSASSPLHVSGTKFESSLYSTWNV